MPVDPNNPNFIVSQENLALVEKKERESRMASGMTASWMNGPDALDPAVLPPDKLALINKSRQEHPIKPVVKEQISIPPSQRTLLPKSRLVTIPPQAMKTFKQMLNLFEVVQVNLTSEQAKMLLDHLEKTPTPKNMVDAKALFNLMEILGS